MDAPAPDLAAEVAALRAALAALRAEFEALRDQFFPPGGPQLS